MNKYIDLNRIEFAITNTYSSKCKHCSLGDDLKGKSVNIEKQTAVELIKSVCLKYKIESVMTFGGEPLLFTDTVIAIHNTAQACGV